MRFNIIEHILIWILLILTHSFSLVAKNNQESKLSQTINFALIPNKTCKDSVVYLSASSSSGLVVSFTVINGNVALDSNKITILGAGTVLIEASQPGNSFYEPATSIFRFFEVSSPFYTTNEPFTVSIKTNLCEGDSIKYTTTSVVGISYLWKGARDMSSVLPSLQISNINPSFSGIYSLKVYEAKCVFFDNSYSVTVHAKPLVSIAGIVSELGINDRAIELRGTPQGGILSGNGIVTQYFVPSVAGLGMHQINYKYVDENLCSASTSSTIEVKNISAAREIKVYELITSRQGSKHNIWLIENIEQYHDNEVYVYNSWGVLVYNKKNYTNEPGWKADELDYGSYLYIVKTNENNQIYKGSLFIDK